MKRDVKDNRVLNNKQLEVIRENANIRTLMNKQFEKASKYRDKFLKKDLEHRKQLFNDITQSHKSFKILRKSHENMQKQEKSAQLRLQISKLKAETLRNEEEVKELERKERELLDHFEFPTNHSNTCN